MFFLFLYVSLGKASAVHYHPLKIPVVVLLTENIFLHIRILGNIAMGFPLAIICTVLEQLQLGTGLFHLVHVKFLRSNCFCNVHFHLAWNWILDALVLLYKTASFRGLYDAEVAVVISCSSFSSFLLLLPATVSDHQCRSCILCFETNWYWIPVAQRLLHVEAQRCKF